MAVNGSFIVQHPGDSEAESSEEADLDKTFDDFNAKKEVLDIAQSYKAVPHS